MKKSYIMLGCIFFMTFLSCEIINKDDVGDINFRFKLYYGDTPFEMFQTYEYPVTKDKFLMTRLSFFISNLTIRSKDGDFNLKDIDYLNLTKSHTAPLETSGLEYKITGIKVGQYESFDFGVGVPALSNALAPKDFKSGHILSSAAEYWSAWQSYIFFRPEGQIGLNAAPTPENPFALHLGSDEAYKVISLNKPFNIVKDKVTDVDIILDMQKFFSGKTVFDIRQTQQIHSLNQKPLIVQLSENLATAFK